VTHPRYRGQVIDAHCHYDVSTHEQVHETNRCGGLAAAVHFWDIAWPPVDSVTEASGWRHLEPALFRCHVPDLSRVGEPGGDQRLARELRAAADVGVVGVKVWKNLGLWLRDTDGKRFGVNDPRLESLWATAGALGLPIAIHQGDPPAFFAPLTDDNPRIEELRVHPDWWYGGHEFPSLQQIHEELEETIAANPATKFIAVHFGCFMDWADVGRMFDTYAIYHVDTAAAIADMGRDDSPETVRRIIVDNADRVIFGTDLIRTQQFDMPDPGPADRWDLASFFERHWAFFETDGAGLEHPLPAQGAWTVRGLDLPNEVLSRIYSENARAVYRLPTPVIAPVA
jgi:predicted TIM-barrel fold metal-dependent hydrolase